MIVGSLLGLATAQLMEKIKETYGDDAEILDALVIGEVKCEDRDYVETFCTSERAVVREGLMARASSITAEGAVTSRATTANSGLE